MTRKKKEVYWELVRRYREFEDGPILEEALGLYCSKERAVMERGIYEDTQIHEVQDEITVDLKVRKYTETIDEVDLISIDELNSLAEGFENESFYY